MIFFLVLYKYYLKNISKFGVFFSAISFAFFCFVLVLFCRSGSEVSFPRNYSSACWVAGVHVGVCGAFEKKMEKKDERNWDSRFVFCHLRFWFRNNHHCWWFETYEVFSSAGWFRRRTVGMTFCAIHYGRIFFFTSAQMYFLQCASTRHMRV